MLQLQNASANKVKLGGHSPISLYEQPHNPVTVSGLPHVVAHGVGYVNHLPNAMIVAPLQCFSLDRSVDN